MKYAFVRAGTWFFGTIIAVSLFGWDKLKDMPLQQAVIIVLVAAAVIAGAVFFWTWQQLEEDRYDDGHTRHRKAQQDESSARSE